MRVGSAPVCIPSLVRVWALGDRPGRFGKKLFGLPVAARQRALGIPLSLCILCLAADSGGVDPTQPKSDPVRLKSRQGKQAGPSPGRKLFFLPVWLDKIPFGS